MSNCFASNLDFFKAASQLNDDKRSVPVSQVPTTIQSSVRAVQVSLQNRFYADIVSDQNQNIFLITCEYM